ncbi:fructoselysine 3-epimerase [Symmachiella macrocystis]|uniref:Fructoselysine 3-epimerase n=1 Tax=Symmachiella macrocystis TaxID=2527985 RepID=A0A5C6BKC3_9PLAN|nr:sugar phosphate isomerase/epimerase [Symmachiella macrocystis]TWU12593.1 fructoselysine 3-epimerase [Symmachiella macrocystis]
MHLSFYTYSYTDVLDQPIPETLAFAAGVGYTRVDVSGTHGKSNDPGSFDAARRKLTRETAERFGLRVAAVITHAELTGTIAAGKPLDLKGSVDLAVDLGAPVVTFHMGGPQEGIAPEALWKKTAKAIRAAADYGSSKHVSLAVDGIWPTWIDDSPDALQRLFDDVGSDDFGVNFDPCYLELIDVDPVKFFDRFAKRIRHTHLKDHIGKYPKWTHHIPGQGSMDYTPLVAVAAKHKYSGAMTVECFTNMELTEAARVGFRTMTAAAEKTGMSFVGAAT